MFSGCPSVSACVRARAEVLFSRLAVDFWLVEQLNLLPV